MGPMSDEERRALYHAPEPVAATVRKLDGTEASLLDVRAYPVTAACRHCGREISCANYLLAPWKHVDAQGANVVEFPGPRV